MASARAVLHVAARAADIAVWILLGAMGAVVSAFLAPWAVAWAGRAWSVGIPLALAITAFALAAAAHDGKGLGAWVGACAWIVTIVVLSWPRAEGDIVIPGTWYGYLYIFGGMAIAFGVIAFQWWRGIAVLRTAAASDPAGVGR